MLPNPAGGRLSRAFTTFAGTSRPGRLTLFIFPVLLLLFGLAFWHDQAAYAAVSDITVTIYAPPNLVVDSNVLSPSTQAPEVATVIGRFCNTSGTTQTAVVGYIGDYNAATPSSSTPGVYPAKNNVTIGGQLYSGTYRFGHLGGTADATRLIGDIPAGECRYQYWSFTYPKTANSGAIPAWGGSVKPDDDLFLDFDVWAAQAGTLCNATACNKTHTATMRNEISAMANKIEPNGNPGGQWFNTNAATVNVGETITTNGILYRLGNINQGFDNNNDLVPDYNAWLQPIGNPTYDPSCFRLISVSGLFTVTRSSGPDLVIPFNHSLNQSNNAPLLYFTDLPQDNTDANGLVYYTFMALGGPCAVPVSPYQEVASGSDNEKFNGDYGAGGPGKINSYAPNLTFDKTGPTLAAEATPFQYAISFQNTGPTSMGLPLSTGLAAGFVVSDTVPNGLQYIGGSAASSNTVPPGNSYVIYYSTNSGLTWSTTDPGTLTSTGPNNLVMLQWWLNAPLAAGQSGTVRYQAQFPSGYGAGVGDRFVDNCADARLGTGSPLARDCATTGISGANTLGDRVWADNGAGTGGVAHNGAQDGTEASIANITVNLYWDRDNDGILDTTDPLINTQSTSAANPNYDFINLPDARYIVVVDTADPQLPVGYGPTTAKQYAVNLNDAGNLDYNAADFGFGPSLDINKYLISSNPAYEGDTVSFRIDLTNKLPGDGTSAGNCRYMLWATIAYPNNTNDPPGGNNLGAEWQATGSALNTPDSAIAYTVMADNTDLLGLSGFNAGGQLGNITNVRFIAYTEEIIDLKATDSFFVRVWYTAGGVGAGSAIGTYQYLGNGTFAGSATAGYFTSPVGTVYGISENITSLRAWTWSDFAGNITEMQVEGNKGGGGGSSGDLGLDAAAYIITTDQVCGGEDTTITTVPVADTYDADLLQFLSATPTHSTNTTTGASPDTNGTITWANVGPLYAGQTKSITVTFTARDPGATAITTTNTALTNNAFFGNGRPVNTDTDPADVQIQPTGSISGRVWSDVATIGWQGTTGYAASDTFIPGVTITLFGCYTNNPASGGTLITTADTSKTCSGQSSNANWYAVPGKTATTAADGSYSFTGLRLGYYYVNVTSGVPAGATQSAEPIYNSTGLTCGTPNATCNGNWSPTGAATTVFNTNLSTAAGNFNPIGTGNPLGTPNEDIFNVNFGYQNVSARIYGLVYSDENANGSKDGAAEEPLSGVTVRLCTDPACGVGTVIATVNTAADGSYSFTGFTTPGNYYVVVTQPANTIQSDDPDNTGTCGGSCDNRTNVIAVTAGQISGSYDFGYHPSSTYTIGDLLFVDWNGNGLQDSGEEGIANVTVSLYEDENNDGLITANADALIESVSTSGTGVYNFTNLVTANYIVVVHTSDPDFPGFAGTYSQTADPDGACPGVLCESTSTTAAIAGTNDLDNDFGYRPTGFGSIGDYVWRDTDADGLQDSGETGINGVTVNLYQDQNGDGVIDSSVDALVATTTTAGNGDYLFSNLAAANYIISIPLNEFSTGQELSGTTMTTGGAAYTNSSTQISYKKTLTAGEDFRAADFGFATGRIGDLIWRDDNGNGTPDIGEPGINGVTVSLYRDNNANGIQDGGDTFLSNTTTNTSGIYSFTGLPAGNYVVVVSPPANHTLTGDPDAYSTNPAFPYPPCSPTNLAYIRCDHQYAVNLYAGETDLTADFGYKPLGVIGDTLWLDGDNDGVRDTGESGIPFITVRLCSALPCTGGNILQTTETNIDGYYSFGGLNNGTYFVQVDSADPDFLVMGPPAQSYDPDNTLDHTANSIVITGGVVTSIGGTPCTNCDLNLDFGYRYSGTNAISGTIWHDDDSGGQSSGTGDIDAGETVRYAGVTVYLWRCIGACDNGSDEILVGTTTTNSAGQYSFPGLDAGTYAVSYSPSSPGLAGLTTTTTTTYDGSPGADPSVTFAGSGSSAIRDFGLRSNLDFGDLPISYNRTILGDDGARHAIPGSGAVYLGPSGDIDSDPDGQESATAGSLIDGDDGDGNDDEDGVIRNASWANGTNGASVSVQAVCPTGVCYLSAWVDWNHDGDFLDSGERVLLDRTVNDGTQTVLFNVPAGTFSGGGTTFNVRFRLYRSSTGGAAQPTGYAVNGEVEDYQWSFGPTAVTLRQTMTTLTQPALLVTATLLLLALLATLFALRRRPMTG